MQGKSHGGQDGILTAKTGAWALILLLIIVCAGCERKATPAKGKPLPKETAGAKPAGMNVNETRLATIPLEYEKWRDIVFSDNGRHVSYIPKKNGKEMLVIGYGERESVSAAYDEISGFVPSLDGRRFSFAGSKGEKKELVLDNDNTSLPGLYWDIAPSFFSPGDRYLACEVRSGREEDWFVALFDGDKEVYRSPVFPETFMPPVFSPDGRVLVYQLGDSNRKTTNKNKTVFFLDIASAKIISEQHTVDTDINQFSFSFDSSRVVYDMQAAGKKNLVLQDLTKGGTVRRAELPANWMGEFLLTPDGEHIIYNASRAGKQYLLLGPWDAPERGKEGRLYDEIHLPVFSPDRKTVGYYAQRQGKWAIVIGDKEGAKYDGFGETPIVFSADGGKAAYPARVGGMTQRNRVYGGKWKMVVSPAASPGAAKEGPLYDMVISPVFSPDGRRIAYRARRGPLEKAERFIVIADADTGKVIKEGRKGDEIWPPVWSADGKTVGYGARIGRELWWKIEKLP